ncbi:MAG: STAS domain-containing protein, partial [candidate division KSB1 bacterium]|nr:STAS domain-containing protein [candidate division KSB1 bacterium]
LRVKGYIDTQTCAEMLQQMTATFKQGIYHLIIDMGQVNYVSSAGWGVFVGEIKGIRENGGDLKLVQMTPEVYDVFEMLEFNRILDCYDSIEEAIDDFDLSIGLDITKSLSQPLPSIDHGDGDVAVASPSPTARIASRRNGEGPRPKARPGFTKTKIDERRLPLMEKIKVVVIDNPTLGARKIRQVLNTERFGYTKVSWWQVRKTLKALNLATKEQRYRFYRSR